MANGNLVFDENGYGRGTYVSLAGKLALALEPAGDDYKRDPRKPSHNVYVSTAHGMVPVGAAWAKEGERGNLIGKTFYSLSIDDPSLPAGLNLSLFPAQGGKPGEFEIVWRRERAAAAA